MLSIWILVLLPLSTIRLTVTVLFTCRFIFMVIIHLLFVVQIKLNLFCNLMSVPFYLNNVVPYFPPRDKRQIRVMILKCPLESNTILNTRRNTGCVGFSNHHPKLHLDHREEWSTLLQTFALYESYVWCNNLLRTCFDFWLSEKVIEYRLGNCLII